MFSVDCGEPSFDKGNVTSYNFTMEGSTAYVTCASNYSWTNVTADAVQVMTCTNLGTWKLDFDMECTRKPKCHERHL